MLRHSRVRPVRISAFPPTFCIKYERSRYTREQTSEAQKLWKRCGSIDYPAYIRGTKHGCMQPKEKRLRYGTCAGICTYLPVSNASRGRGENDLRRLPEAGLLCTARPSGRSVTLFWALSVDSRTAQEESQDPLPLQRQTLLPAALAGASSEQGARADRVAHGARTALAGLSY
jgi:hypothetical protein